MTDVPHPNDLRFQAADTVDGYRYPDARAHHRLKLNTRVRVQRPELYCAFMGVVTQVIQGQLLDIYFIQHLYALDPHSGNAINGLVLRESSLMVGCRDPLWIEQPDYEVFPT